MTTPTPTMLPPDAFAKSEEAAKDRDYYANLTDEQRAEEGLPPLEKPAGDPPPETEPTETEPEEEESPDADEATGRLFDELAELRGQTEAMHEDLAARMGKPEPPATPSKQDELIEAALDHDDPVVRGMAEQLHAAQQQLAALTNEAKQQREARQLAKDTADFDDVKNSYTIDGKPMTDAQIEAVEDYLLEPQNKEVARLLSIEEATRRVFPSAERVRTSPPPGKRPASRPGNGAGEGGRTATIVDEGTSGGAPAGPWKPRNNETVESAVNEAGRRLFGVKR